MARHSRTRKTDTPHGWVDLLTIMGPFPGETLLHRHRPDGLHRTADESRLAADLGMAYEAWCATPDPAHHRAWLDLVLDRVLGFDQPACRREDAPLPALETPGAAFAADLVLHDPEDRRALRLLVTRLPRGRSPSRVHAGAEAAPRELMARLCRATGVPLGLVTDGEEWVLVHASDDAVSYVVFTARDWLEERDTLRAFYNLLHVRTFFSVPDAETTAALFQDALKDTTDVTDMLGRQVREAVEILVRTFDQLDLEQDRRLLHGLSEAHIYQGALTVMMRLVLVFCAEDRGLFPRETNRFYADNYALGNLRAALRAKADRHGEELLERGYDAWGRLLAHFRLIHAGLRHPRLQIPAYGGSLFDPDRFLFLEGRTAADQGVHAAAPPRVDNRTVLHLLEALQILRLAKGRTRFLDFQNLSPEDVGHVYEGLLDHTAIRAAEPVLGLAGTGSGNVDHEPEVGLSVLEAEAARGSASLTAWLKKHTRRGANSLAKALAAKPDHTRRNRILRACGGDTALAARILPFQGLLRDDTRGVPFVVAPRGVYVTGGTDRRNSGTHYTPRTLSEDTVRHTLDPLVYHGPAEGLPEHAWTLRAPEALLALKICDPAMGSGAFLVQTCRYLAARLVEAWAQRAAFDPALPVQPHAAPSTGALPEALIGGSDAERLAHARRLVCTRSLYGVDKNPMAVDMAKLSLWLITLDAARPFTFLDHHLTHGDSLLGLADPDHLLYFHTDPTRGRTQHRWTGGVRDLIAHTRTRVLQLRAEIEAEPAGTITELHRQERLTAEADQLTTRLTRFADLFIGAVLTHAGKPKAFEAELALLAHRIEEAAAGDGTQTTDLGDLAGKLLGEEPLTHARREPFHWVLVFPEVFAPDRGGFDAIVGNPPFLGGKKITGPFGSDYRDYLLHYVAGGARGNADLCAYFYLRAYQLTRSGGCFGLIATNTIAQGDTREVGLDRLTAAGCSIYRALPSRKWPGSANLEVAQTWLHVGPWRGSYTLNGRTTPGITAYLEKPGKVQGTPYRLHANKNLSYIGSYLLGMGFVLTPEEAEALIAKDPKNADVLYPYLNGEDLNTSPEQQASRWVINFHDWPLDRASQPEKYQGPVAADYPDCLRILEEKVKPERTRKKADGTFQLRKPLPQRWWQYADKRPALYRSIETLEHVIALSLVNNHLAFPLVPARIVFSHKLCIIPRETFETIGILQSSTHYHWSWKYSSTLRKDINYSPSDTLETFPLPNKIDNLRHIASNFYDFRQEIMRETHLGLTKTYNRYHDPRDLSPEIQRLRRLQIDLDREVLKAYGWSDLILHHDFYTIKQGLRYTIAPDETDEILDRLLALNHARYAEEVKAGLHDAPKKKTTPIKPKAKQKPKNPKQMELFDS